MFYMNLKEEMKVILKRKLLTGEKLIGKDVEDIIAVFNEPTPKPESVSLCIRGGVIHDRDNGTCVVKIKTTADELTGPNRDFFLQLASNRLGKLEILK